MLVVQLLKSVNTQVDLWVSSVGGGGGGLLAEITHIMSVQITLCGLC